MNQYEAMFLFDPTFASSFEACETEIRRLMDRAGAEIILCRKWDERRLAFRVQGRKRGVYVLTYFRCASDKITPLERDGKLSEHVLRMLVLRADRVTPEAMEKAFELHAEESPRGYGGRDNQSSRSERPRSAPARPREAVQKERPAPDSAVTTTTTVTEPPADGAVETN